MSEPKQTFPSYVYKIGTVAAVGAAVSFQPMAAVNRDKPTYIEPDSARATEGMMAYDDRHHDAKLATLEARIESKAAVAALEVQTKFGDLKALIAALATKNEVSEQFASFNTLVTTKFGEGVSSAIKAAVAGAVIAVGAGWAMYTHLDNRLDSLNRAREDDARAISKQISEISVQLKGIENGSKSDSSARAK